jgi:hypothetical protein
MTNRWFSDDELRAMSRPTMDRAIEAIDRGDLAAARALCDEMRTEWRFMHDLLVDGMAAMLTFIHDKLGDDGVADAHRDALERRWKHQVEAIDRADRKDMVRAIAASWRAHSGSGTGPSPGAFQIREDDEKLTFAMNPCGSGQRLWRMKRYEGPGAYALTDEAHDWSYGRAKFPIYCTHCTFMNEIGPIRWIGYPVYPSEAPDDFDRDPCVWYWYKDPAAIPEKYWTRYGMRKGARP